MTDLLVFGEVVMIDTSEIFLQIHNNSYLINKTEQGTPRSAAGYVCLNVMLLYVMLCFSYDEERPPFHLKIYFPYIFADKAQKEDLETSYEK